MGFDISFHPVDLRLVEDRILPYIDGARSDLDDLAVRAVERLKVRMRAKAWAIGALKNDGFDADLYAWGRPYLITAPDTEGVVEAYHRYQESTLDTVDELALAQLRALDPALPGKVKPEMPDPPLPGDDVLAAEFVRRLRLLREAVAALRSGRAEITDSDGETLDAAQGLAANTAFVVLDFAAIATPGWMERGYVWPTMLAEKAGAGPAAFTGHGQLLGSLREQLPEVPWRPEPTITENYAVGGFVAAADVPGARVWFSKNAARLRGPGAAEGYAEHVDLALRKLDEAFAVAASLGAAFAEATEIYSGFEGQLN